MVNSESKLFSWRNTMINSGSTRSNSSRNTNAVSLAKSASSSISRSKCCKQRLLTWWPSISWFLPKSNARLTVSWIQTNWERCASSRKPLILSGPMPSIFATKKPIGRTWFTWSFKATLELRCSKPTEKTGSFSSEDSLTGGACSPSQVLLSKSLLRCSIRTSIKRK